jgi:signal peptidase II
MTLTHRITGFVAALFVLIADQLSKMMALQAMNGQSHEVLPFFNLVLVWNRGVSFGMFNHGDPLPPLVFVAVSMAIACGFAVWLWRAENRMIALGLGLVIGGAIGNVIDRLVHGAVVDFLDFHLGDLHWPAFNIADSGIVIGIALVVIDGLCSGTRKTGRNPI